MDHAVSQPFYFPSIVKELEPKVLKLYSNMRGTGNRSLVVRNVIPVVDWETVGVYQDRPVK
jgi:hypothetical protein